ncbi:fumarylacetoacetate hydrolase family protein [Comamonas endophytica]|uniref:Fumarylacetoacetate hydrolase family protein n=1 Tax=Comamonas endophytica TaxID=2949090 RepID=A0ABY6GF61_9BURK|nr:MULTISPECIES: fumarylacetoacetate hydrolase family protein [unclassified Acidovorax]MCD2514438.1 fumarylacetoacetate hydrolase family protein [Acidovorax sp. D4N7]UYG53727.1 fumarylacetoacetate hydrolase family protein [Acidovorax sp. 5MLIR]
MTDFVFPAPAPAALSVAGSAAAFPLARVFCIGRNYRWSAHEAAPAQMPAWFMKPASAVCAARGELPYPPETGDFCHEIELVVAIGRGGQDIDPAQVPAHVWGYAAGLDLTRRDLQQQAKQAGGPWEPAKAFDHSAPCTPLVPVAACGHPTKGAIWLTVNGSERQRADLSGLLWTVPELVAMLSRSVALMPGDLIFTGTPAGVGPMLPGDAVEGGVEGIGRFCMTVAQRAATPHRETSQEFAF